MAMKWTGDNAATWHDLRWTISSVLLTGLVGIPDVGQSSKALSAGLSREIWHVLHALCWPQMCLVTGLVGTLKVGELTLCCHGTPWCSMADDDYDC